MNGKKNFFNNFKKQIYNLKNMEVEYIHIKDFCSGHNIEEAFIFGLQEYELIELRSIDNQQFIYVEELPKVEKMVRLHLDLHINLEGIEAIYHLLERTLQLQNEIRTLKNRLKRQGEV